MTSDDTFVALGRADGSVGIGALEIDAPTGQNNYALFEMSSDFTPGWVTLLEHGPGPGAALPVRVEPVPTGGVVAVLSPAHDVLVAGQSLPSLGGTRDGLLLRLAADGTLIWARRFGGSGETLFSDVYVPSSFPAVYVTGAFTETANFGASDMVAPMGENEAVLLAYDLDTGDILYQRTFGGPGDQPRSYLAPVAGTHLAVSTGTNASVASFTVDGVALGPGPGAFVVQFDLAGTVAVGGAAIGPVDVSDLLVHDGVVTIEHQVTARRLSANWSLDWLFQPADLSGQAPGHSGCVRQGDGLIAFGGQINGSFTIAGSTVDQTAGFYQAFVDASGQGVGVLDLTEERAQQGCAFLADGRVVLVGAGGLGIVTPPP